MLKKKSAHPSCPSEQCCLGTTSLAEEARGPEVPVPPLIEGTQIMDKALYI